MFFWRFNNKLLVPWQLEPTAPLFSKKCRVGGSITAQSTKNNLLVLPLPEGTEEKTPILVNPEVASSPKRAKGEVFGGKALGTCTEDK
jgi:hypothetical protein